MTRAASGKLPGNGAEQPPTAAQRRTPHPRQTSAPHPHREPRSPWPAAQRPTRRSLATEPCTSNEAQPLGQDVSGLGLDEDLAAVERDAGPQLPAHIKHGWFLGARREQSWGVLGTTLRTTPSYGGLRRGAVGRVRGCRRKRGQKPEAQGGALHALGRGSREWGFPGQLQHPPLPPGGH